MRKKIKRKTAVQYFILITLILFATACGSSTSRDAAESVDTNSSPDPGDFENRVPNNGAVVKIISPTNGTSFKKGEQVILEIDTENFDMSAEGNHWHVYVDGDSWGMVTGGNMDQPLTGLPPGEHEIGVYLSIDTHEELEEGDSISINVNE